MDPKFVGKTVDSYQILEVLGQGGMGIVYRARDLMLEKDVAVKMMDARLDPEGRMLKRFQEEARSLARLQHPNIVGIYALRESQLGLCIVMEFVRGKNLSEIIRDNGPLPLPRVKKIFLQCLNALDHAHKEGIIHRDIKPSNIMLTSDDVVKITDFGLAKRTDPTLNASTVLVGGTLFYSPPEQLDSLSNVDFRGDIYSLGMTMYEALAGKTPFADTNSDFKIRRAIVDGDIPRPDKIRPDLPDDIVAVVMKSIHRDPDKRYKSAAAMQEALERCSVSAPVARQRRPFPVKAIAIGVMVLALAVLLYLFVPLPFGSGSSPASGTVTIVVRGESGAPLPDAVVTVSAADGSPSDAVQISDVRTAQPREGTLTVTTDSRGESHVMYKAPSGAHLQVSVDTDGYTRGTEKIGLPRDSLLVVLYRIPAPTAEGGKPVRLSMIVRDGGGNPVPGASITLQGISGKEYAARTDGRGRASLENYAIGSDGDRPNIRVGVDRFDASLQQGKAQSVAIGPDHVLTLNINDFVPYDKTRDDLRKGVEAMSAEIRKIKEGITASASEKRSNATFQRAQQYEALGERQVKQENFNEALTTLLQAKDLYATAAESFSGKESAPRKESAKGNITDSPPPDRRSMAEDSAVRETPNPVPERHEPPRETARKEIAPPDVQGILRQYKSNYEKADLASLTSFLHLTQKEQSTWSTFFDVTEEVRVTTEKEQIQKDNDNARVTFGVKISYQNKADGRPGEIAGNMVLGLQYVNGKWEIVSHRFEK